MATATAVPGDAPLSQAQRIINVFVAPTKTFNDIKRSSSWWAAWLLMAVVSFGFVATAAQKVGWEEIQQNQMKMNPKQMERLEKAPPDQRERQLRIGLTVTKGISFVFPVIQLVLLSVIALIMMATMNFGASAQTKFGQCLAVTMYSALPGLVKILLAIVFLFLGIGVEGFTFQNPIATNPGVFAQVGTPLYALLSAFDIFTFWTLILAGIGFACISGLKRATTTAMVFGWWAFGTLIGVGMAALFS
jgi:hypothetical protein